MFDRHNKNNIIFFNFNENEVFYLDITFYSNDETKLDKFYSPSASKLIEQIIWYMNIEIIFVHF